MAWLSGLFEPVEMWIPQLVPPRVDGEPLTGTPLDRRVKVVVARGRDRIVVRDDLDAAEPGFGMALLQAWADAAETARDLNGLKGG